MNEVDKHALISQRLRDTNYNSYDELELIGRGGAATVHKCRDKENNLEFVMKKIFIQDPSKEDAVIKEVLFLSSFEPNERLVKFYGSKKISNFLHIYLEYMPLGSLQDYINENGALTEEHTSTLTKEILEGIEYLHNAKIIHRDIKPANILIGKNNSIKLTDFGISKLVEDLTALSFITYIGTVRYMAPELLKCLKCNHLIDIWSLGITVLQMVNGVELYPNLLLPQIMCKIMDPDFAFELIHPASKELLYFLTLTFIKSAERRPSASDMKLTKFITREELSPSNM